MEIADLARWTPIRFDFSGPAPMVDWADLSAERFDEPFFDQTARSLGPVQVPSQLVRTGLDAFVALDSEPSLDPAGMIFHLSRCGSTLVSRLLGALPGVVVVAEPSPLNALLGLDPARVDAAALVQIVRLLVRALGRRRHGDERQPGAQVHQLEHPAPGSPGGRVSRDALDLGPARAGARPGLVARPSRRAGLGFGTPPQQSAARFGLDPAAVPAMTRAEFAARALGAMLEAAARPIRPGGSASTTPNCPARFGNA